MKQDIGMMIIIDIIRLSLWISIHYMTYEKDDILSYYIDMLIYDDWWATPWYIAFNGAATKAACCRHTWLVVTSPTHNMLAEIGTFCFDHYRSIYQTVEVNSAQRKISSFIDLTASVLTANGLNSPTTVFTYNSKRFMLGDVRDGIVGWKWAAWRSCVTKQMKSSSRRWV